MLHKDQFFVNLLLFKKYIFKYVVIMQQYQWYDVMPKATHVFNYYNYYYLNFFVSHLSVF